MQRYYIGLLILFLVVGCSTKKVAIEPKIDLYLFEATYLEQKGALHAAAKLYEKIYTISHDPIALQKAANDYFLAKKYNEALKLVKEGIDRYPNKEQFYYMAGVILAAQKKYDQAKSYLLKAIKIEKNPKAYELLGSIMMAQKEYKLALKYLQRAYALTPSPTAINSIAYIMYFYLHKQKEAIAYLETHIRLYRCQKSVCQTLASFYGLQNDIDGLIATYKRLYQTYREPIYLNKLVDLLIYKGNYQEAIKYLEQDDNEELLLKLYLTTKKFKKAAKLAQELFAQTHNYDYLAKSAIYLFEGATKKDKELLKKVALKLEKAIEHKKDPVYLNYLGYLYIDYNINIQRGIELVKKALQKDPNNLYYLDSLAWGYYKIGKCEEAKKIIDRVYAKLKDNEIKLHLNKIDECLKEKK